MSVHFIKPEVPDSPHFTEVSCAFRSYSYQGKMKGLQIVVVLLVLGISALEARKCNSCVTINGQCNEVEEECEDKNDVCGTVISISPTYTETKSCMTPAEVFLLSQTDNINVKTCSSDLCN